MLSFQISLKYLFLLQIFSQNIQATEMPISLGQKFPSISVVVLKYFSYMFQIPVNSNHLLFPNKGIKSTSYFHFQPIPLLFSKLYHIQVTTFNIFWRIFKLSKPLKQKDIKKKLSKIYIFTRYFHQGNSLKIRLNFENKCKQIRNELLQYKKQRKFQQQSYYKSISAGNNLQNYIMNSKQVILFSLLLTCLTCQSISITSFLKASENLVKTAVSTVGLVEGSEANVTVSDDFIPCGKADSCGEAKTFKSDQDFQDFLNKYRPDQTIINYALPLVADTTTAQFAAKSASLPQPSASRDFSGTNNQEQNVDEADLLKTDGTYIYTISNSILSIILAYPADKARVVSKISLKDLYPSAIFIEGNYLAVFGTQWDYSYQTTSIAVKRIAPIYYQSTSYTWVKIYDVSNRGNPFLAKEFKVEGSYFNGRKLNNGFVYLITNHQFNYGVKANPWYDFGDGKKNVLFSSIFWYPGTYISPSAVNIISFNLKNPLLNQRKIVTICAEWTNVMYMSERHIYLTTSSWENGADYTIIKKIFVSGTYIKPFADGKVRGSVNNQFSLDQYGSILRIATTNNSGNQWNNVFCLDYFLNEYGFLTGIAPGQRIFSARYVGLRLYLVTFRQIDPFFVISFANPKKPKILGELKIPGFSRYLHPYDETTIIGLGRDATAAGQQLGLKLGLFDVTDCSNPIESFSWSIEEKYAYSDAEWEHKAFLFSAEKNLLVIPGNMNYAGTQFNGAFAFYIDKTKIELRGVIDHLLNPSDNFYERNVERSLYIENLLYTKSKCLLRINKISKYFEGVKNINIPCEQVLVAPIKIPLVTPILQDSPIFAQPISTTQIRVASP